MLKDSEMAYILEDLKGQALWDEDSLAKLAANVAWVRIVHGFVIKLLLAQSEVQVGLWYSQHF